VPFRTLFLLLIVATAGVLAWRSGVFGGEDGRPAAGEGGAPAQGRDGKGDGKKGGSPGPADSPTGGSPTGSSPSPTEAGVFTPAPLNDAFPGLVTFRGNATRSYYGEGPLPEDPEVLWEYPRSGGMCSESANIDGTRVWCGTGWTGQPNVIEREDGTLEIRFGAYDTHYHFLDGKTGEELMPDLDTGDLAKGSASSDAEGYPLYYAGSRDDLFRVVATDRKEPTVLWEIHSETSVPDPRWNDDWDGAALQIGDYLFEGSEASWFYIIKLNRSYDEEGLVQVDPEVVFTAPAWDAQLLQDLGDDSVSIENSVALHDGVVYFANSGGLVVGYDVSGLLAGDESFEPERVFRFWMGDEVDATIVIDEEGYLYVGRHFSYNIQTRDTTRAQEVGALAKLDPRNPEDPLVWGVDFGGTGPDGGLLGTVGLYDGVVWAPGYDGEILALDQQTGKQIGSIDVQGPLYGSPVIIDHQLVIGDCSGTLHNFDVSNPRRPKELWTVELEGCIESTPAVWKGMLWLGARGGKFYAIGDA
jgi:outer membrane protein assembly factor BamB